jgi:ABC-type phosphate/phosphonate transport system substrate-binding protein
VLGGALVVLAGAFLPAHAASTDFVVESSGSGGTAENAGPYLEQFTNYADKALKKKVTATFYTDKKAIETAIQEKQPGFGMLDVDEFLDLHKKDDLVVLAAVEGAIHDRGHLHVVAKDAAVKSLDDLKGKVVVSNHARSTAFLGKVVFDGKIDPATFFQLQATTSPLKGLKAVDRGEAAATIIDDAQLAQMKTLPFGAEMHVVFSSSALPPSPFVAFGKTATQKERDSVAKMLLGMCGDKKGSEVCKSFQITKFAKPDMNVFNEAIRRFDK